MDGMAASKGQTAVINKIASDFSSFAGSTEDAQALVTGLRSGSAITLAGGGTATPTDTTATAGSVTFTPPTGSMGNGNVYISLALAKQQLAAAGIIEPTPEQIQIALMGGLLLPPMVRHTNFQAFCKCALTAWDGGRLRILWALSSAP
jgi:hypothetical protein